MGNLNIRRRAMSNDQKEARRQDILDSAWRLFQTTTYERLTIVDVANTLGLAKGTIFLYFGTKEALFLALVEQQLILWFAEVDAKLIDLASACTIEQITEVLIRSLEAYPSLTRLLAILHTILEQNIDFDVASHFKHMLLQHFERTGSLLEHCLPFLMPGQGAHFLMQCHALVIGFWQLANPAPVVQQVLQQPELQMFQVHFASEFSTALQALLYGLEQIQQESPKEERL